MQIITISPDKVSKLQGDIMLQPTDVEKILSLYKLGWGSKRISKELGISRRTTKKYLRLQGWRPPAPRSTRRLAHLEPWLKTNFEKHRGNADVVRQELISEHGVRVSLRTVQRAVQAWRDEERVKALATVRFETPPGKQLQIDFGSTKVWIGEERIKVYLFVATLGYSRRLFIAPFTHERQNVWFDGIEKAFAHFDGICDEVLIDNAKALVFANSPSQGKLVFNERFKSFADYWGFRPRACAPYRARTKGKDERMVSYVKHNAVAGREFPNWEAFKNHLEKWNAEIADVRIHGTTEERPLERFLRDEARALRSLPNKPPFLQIRELTRKVQTDACVELDCNQYSVPCHLVGQRVDIHVTDGLVKISHKGVEVACHAEVEGRRQRVLNSEHLKGIVGAFPHRRGDADVYCPSTTLMPSEMLRPLAEYEALIGGSW